MSITAGPVPAVHFSMTTNEDWRRVRDYVVDHVTQCSGPFQRNPIKEKQIFSAFVNRWGDKALPIARTAFEVHGGFWCKKPIDINRFTKNSDPHFASLIAATL